MKPLVGLFPFSKWVARLTLPVILYLVYQKTMFSFNFKDVNYLIYFGLFVFSILLVLGGFFRKSTLTVISSILLFLFGILLLVVDFSNQMSMIIGTLSIIWGLLFMTMGNRSTNMQKSR